MEFFGPFQPPSIDQLSSGVDVIGARALAILETIAELLPLVSPEDILGPNSSIVADLRDVIAKARGPSNIQ